MASLTTPQMGSPPATAESVSASGLPTAPKVSSYKSATTNPALRMMGLPALPRKLPSRNWLIFLSVATILTGWARYDGREKRRATARWAASVAHLALEPIPSSRQMPRRLTVLVESPPGDGFAPVRRHFNEFVRPILAASGLDWDFVHGRRQGDVRAAVAERIRRERRVSEGLDSTASTVSASRDDLTDNELVESFRRRNGVPAYDGVKGDIVIGRHTWKEYLRGLHEGWLGPLNLPAGQAQVESKQVGREVGAEEVVENKDKDKDKPPRPPPYNSPADYEGAALPAYAPTQLAPVAAIPFPHILGFLKTPTRIQRFFNQRALADSIGRDVAAVCLAASRSWGDDTSLSLSPTSPSSPSTTFSSPPTSVPPTVELSAALEHEEANWPDNLWKDATGTTRDTDSDGPRETVWTDAAIVDARIGSRMRRFVLRPEDEARGEAIVVPESSVEGRTEGYLRQIVNWAKAETYPSAFKTASVTTGDDDQSQNDEGRRSRGALSSFVQLLARFLSQESGQVVPDRSCVRKDGRLSFAKS